MAAAGVAQEYRRVFTGVKGKTATGAVWFSYHRAGRRVTCCYFYVWEEGSGPYADRLVMPRVVGEYGAEQPLRR